LDIPPISENFTQNDFISQSADLMNLTNQELTSYLWNTYHPESIWMVFAGIGFGTVLLLWLYDRLLLSVKSKP